MWDSQLTKLVMQPEARLYLFLVLERTCWILALMVPGQLR